MTGLPPERSRRAPQATLRAVAWPLASMLTVQSLVTMALLSVPVFAVVAAIDLGVPARWIGGYISLVYITAMASSGMGGLFTLRFGAIRMCQACLAIAAISLCLTATGWLPLVVLGALVMGIGYGPPTPASSHLLSRYTPPRLMPLVFSVKQTGVPLGGALAGAIIPVLVLAQGWRAASLYIAAVCLVAMVALQPLRAKFDADRDPGQRLRGNLLTPFRKVMADAVLRRFAFMSFLYSSVQMCLVAYFVTFLVEDITLDLVTAGLVMAVAQTAGIFGRILWGSLSGLVMTARRILALLGLGMAARRRNHGAVHAGMAAECADGGLGAVRGDGDRLERRLSRRICPSRAPGPGRPHHRRVHGRHFRWRGGGAAGVRRPGDGDRRLWGELHRPGCPWCRRHGPDRGHPREAARDR